MMTGQLYLHCFILTVYIFLFCITKDDFLIWSSFCVSTFSFLFSKYFNEKHFQFNLPLFLKCFFQSSLTESKNVFVTKPGKYQV